MGSHSVTCHPTEMNALLITRARQACTRLTYPGGMDSWVDLGCWLPTKRVYLSGTVTNPSSNRVLFQFCFSCAYIFRLQKTGCRGCCWVGPPDATYVSLSAVLRRNVFDCGFFTNLLVAVSPNCHDWPRLSYDLCCCCCRRRRRCCCWV